MNALQWLVYFVAWSASYFCHAQNSVASPSNGVNSIGQWLRLNMKPVIFNLMLTIALGLIWGEAPSFFGSIVKSVPITLGTAIGMGLSIQSLIDRLMYMFGVRVEMPRLVPPTPGDGKAGQ
jgi:hypothetical protein